MEKLMDTMHDHDYCELVEEIYSMQALADLSGKEMLFYAKHIAPGWWMMTAINELKKLLMKHPWLKGVIMDYKNKLIPRMKNVPMSLFFSKSGISILGNMVMWAGCKTIKEKRVEGLFVWFIDIIWENTTSKRPKTYSRALQPCLMNSSSPTLSTELAKRAASCCSQRQRSCLGIQLDFLQRHQQIWQKRKF
jgi:hypothetical protein